MEVGVGVRTENAVLDGWMGWVGVWGGWAIFVLDLLWVEFWFGLGGFEVR